MAKASGDDLCVGGPSLVSNKRRRRRRRFGRNTMSFVPNSAEEIRQIYGAASSHAARNGSIPNAGYATF